ncbi:hypothetical protein HDV04_000336 [Boothiomyces sp. JEL0838]|nr:hypothetical protein HDV04_000336 [Boothiomyces sp. JEL0838]
MNPIDVVRTRYYNQPYVNGKGELYSGALDAITKITTHEGLTAFYKGFWPHFLRIGPHFCLTFVFLGLLRRSTTDAYSYLDKRDSFKAFDMDNDGSLNINEIKNAVQTIFAPMLDKNSDQIPVMVERILAKSKDKDRVSFQEYGMMEQEIKAIYKELQKVKQ